jgi:hypothetical protein
MIFVLHFANDVAPYWSPSGGIDVASDLGYLRCWVNHLDGIQVQFV